MANDFDLLVVKKRRRQLLNKLSDSFRKIEDAFGESGAVHGVTIKQPLENCRVIIDKLIKFSG